MRPIKQGKILRSVEFSLGEDEVRCDEEFFVLNCPANQMRTGMFYLKRQRTSTYHWFGWDEACQFFSVENLPPSQFCTLDELSSQTGAAT